MHFEGTPPDLVTRLRLGWAWRIFGSGLIDLHSAERLQRFMVKNDVPHGSHLYLDSSGGSLIGGMALGRTIREYNLIVEIGRKGQRDEFTQHSEPGECMSACAIAFLGGEYRYVSSDEKYGVHRFALESDEPPSIDRAQKLSAEVVDYIRSMDVDTELFTLASDFGVDEMFEPPIETLVRLNVVNYGFKRPTTSIESIEGILYLKVQRETVYGMQKFLVVFPEQGDPYLHIIFDAGQSVDLAMGMGVDHLLIDREMIAAEEYRIKRQDKDGDIHAIYGLTRELISKLLRASTVGLTLRMTTEAPMFLGFDGMPFSEAAAKLPGLLNVHARGKSNEPAGK